MELFSQFTLDCCISPGLGLSLTLNLGLIDCYKIAVLPELVVCEGSITEMVKACKEPSAVLGVHEESLAGALVVLFRDGENLRGSVTRGGLGRPHTNLPPVVEDEALWTAVLEDGVVVLVLVELDAPVEPGAILWVSVVALPGTLQDRLGVLSDALYLALPVHDPHDSEGGDVNAVSRGDGDDVLSGGKKILLQTGYYKLPGLPLEVGGDVRERVEERLTSLATHIVEVVSVNTVQPNSGQTSQQRVLRL